MHNRVTAVYWNEIICFFSGLGSAHDGEDGDVHVRVKWYASSIQYLGKVLLSAGGLGHPFCAGPGSGRALDFEYVRDAWARIVRLALGFDFGCV